MTKNAIFILAVIFLSGCGVVSHKREISTLKALAKEKSRQEKFIQKQDQKFEELLVAVEGGDISKYKTKKSVLRRFGEPIFKRSEAPYEMWFYRYATQAFGSPKVYLYFDYEQRLVNWKLVKPNEEDRDTNREDITGPDEGAGDS